MKYHNYKGESYTVTQLSALSGVCLSTLSGRLSRGMSVEDAVEREAGFNKLRITDPATGETDCLNGWATKLGLTASALYYRLRSGWPIEKVLSAHNYRDEPDSKTLYERLASPLAKQYLTGWKAPSSLLDLEAQGYGPEWT